MGTLYLVGTPIGNLQDMTFRGVETLKSVHLIACEDTRHTAKLLHYYHINTPTISYHHHNSQERLPELIKILTSDRSIALVTDAGQPAISDPGLELVQACIAENISIVPIPSATAGITALICSGLTTERFVFEGFLPTTGKEGRARLESLRQEERTIILYEAPHRLLSTLDILREVLGGERRLAIGRELTKIHEQIWRGTIQECLDYFQTHSPKGEFTIVIAGKTITPHQWNDTDLQRELINLLQQGMSKSSASKYLAEVTQVPRRHIYQLSLGLDEE
jgi:16S rRNA (cytidine1402-2'-O)-methyltransferase